jgi:3-(3-hydroxy-phenyl)propionate hydroxylase
MANKEVLIVGAGPTGMAAAIELMRLGIGVRIVDKSDHLARYSQALVVQARTLEQFQRYGLAEKAIARGRKLHGARFYSEGKQIVHIKLDEVSSRYPFALFLPQSETEALLNEHMESLGAKTERGVELGSVAHGPETRCTLRHADGRDEEVSPRWLIGCDGAHSVVREKTGTAFEGARVAMSFFLADAEIEGPEVPAEELALHVSKGDVLFMGRLSDRVVRLIVAFQEEPQLDRNLTVADFQRMIDRIGVRVQIRSANWMTPFHVTDRQAEHYRIGNIFLAGDASHIHSPVGGQGMNTGIQDAANLGWKLAAVARGADDVLLNSYEEERGAVGRALLRFTERGLKVASLSNPVMEKLRDTLAPIMVKVRAVQHAALGFVSETAIEYRESSAVSDLGGDGVLRAGDRLPDLPVWEGGTLLGDWTARRHRVFGLNLDQADIDSLKRSLRHADVVSLSTKDLDDAGRRLMGDEPKILVMRPDGYLGFRSRVGYHDELTKYALQDGLA